MRKQKKMAIDFNSGNQGLTFGRAWCGLGGAGFFLDK